MTRLRPITDVSPPKRESPEHLLDRHPRLWPGSNRFFAPVVVKKFPELIPVLAIVVFVPTLALITMHHNLFKNPGVRLGDLSDDPLHTEVWLLDFKMKVCMAGLGMTNKSDPMGPHEYVGPTESRKFYNSQPDSYKPIPDLEAIKKDLREAAP